MKRLYLAVCLLFITSISFALNFGEIKTISRALARDPIPTNGSPRIAETFVSSYTNIGMNEIVANTWCLETSSSITITKYKREYTLPNDIISIKRVLLDNNLIKSTSISKKDVNDPNWEDNLSTGTPTTYYSDMGANVLGFDTYPSTTTDKILKITYIKQPIALTSDSAVPFDNQPRLIPYHYAICLFTASMICYQDNRATEGDRFYGMYVDRIKNMAASIGLSGDYYPSMSGNTNSR